MCNCFNNNNNRIGMNNGQNCYFCPYYLYPIRQQIGGARGPQGPAGPVGPSGLNDSVYADVATATVTSGAIIPVFLSASTTPTSSTVTSGAVNVTEGVYLVSYGFSGVPSSATDGISVSLYANGAPLANGEITQIGAGEVSANKTLLYNATGNTTLSLYNTSATTETLDYPYISVTKLQ